MTMRDAARVGQIVLALGRGEEVSLRTWEWSRLPVGPGRACAVEISTA